MHQNLRKGQAAPAEDQQVDLVPLALSVAELEVAPGLERAPVGQQVEALLSMSPDWSALPSAIGGGPRLLKAADAQLRTFCC